MIRARNLIVFVADPPAATAFWRAVLDAAPTLDVPGMTEFDLGGGTVLGLMPERGITRLLDGAVEPAQIDGAVDPAQIDGAVDHARTPDATRAELYLTVDDPAAWHARALAAGARELSPLRRRDWGDDAAYALAPDGLILAFAARSSVI